MLLLLILQNRFQYLAIFGSCYKFAFLKKVASHLDQLSVLQIFNEGPALCICFLNREFESKELLTYENAADSFFFNRRMLI
jgi:hypothetical protein